mmetsp:Transcript_20234/g.51340  ORF Transcript_20234/g.51340 Transcript_20234/m.51340 type:complete len:129 (-) Transcript_20234:195-581(-)
MLDEAHEGQGVRVGVPQCNLPVCVPMRALVRVCVCVQAHPHKRPCVQAKHPRACARYKVLKVAEVCLLSRSTCCSSLCHASASSSVRPVSVTLQTAPPTVGRHTSSMQFCSLNRVDEGNTNRAAFGKR